MKIGLKRLMLLGGLTLAHVSAWAVTACLQAPLLPTGWPKVAHSGQVAIAAGEFVKGSQSGYADERPEKLTRVSAFWIDRTEVSNAQFAAFAKATAYVTTAERQGGSAVFVVPTADELQRRPVAWWRFVKGANWRHPKGPGSSIRGQDRYPVVHVTQADALAYAHWLGRDLPTETEWEYAAKAGQRNAAQDVAPRDANQRPSANYWQGQFPLLDTAEDGYAGLAPVACYAPNAFGLYDMIGNAWEWTKDVASGPVQGHANGDPSVVRPQLGRQGEDKVVIKGGSFLCSPDYCVRYRAAARESQEADVSTSHVGFRTVSRP